MRCETDLAAWKALLVDLVTNQLLACNEFVILDSPPYYVQAHVDGAP